MLAADSLRRLQALHPKTIELGLERLEVLLARCGEPQRHLPPAIHIAGTNGKGSTLAMLFAGLKAAHRVVMHTLRRTL
jgi:dihydrofolate synthase/folylpolyglutamate synthase